jgi:four helix bundle protein
MNYPTYRDLKAWQKAMQLVTAIYFHTQGFPKEETYGLTSQMRRAAVSVPSNIAEGQGRRLEGDFQHFLRNARGSLLELETQVLIATNLGFLPHRDADKLLASSAEVGRILNGLIASLRNKLTTEN